MTKNEKSLKKDGRKKNHFISSLLYSSFPRIKPPYDGIARESHFKPRVNVPKISSQSLSNKYVGVPLSSVGQEGRGGECPPPGRPRWKVEGMEMGERGGNCDWKTATGSCARRATSTHLPPLSLASPHFPHLSSLYLHFFVHLCPSPVP